MYSFGEKKTITTMEIIPQDAWGQVYHNKFHKEKRLETRRTSLCQNIKKKHFIYNV